MATSGFVRHFEFLKILTFIGSFENPTNQIWSKNHDPLLKYNYFRFWRPFRIFDLCDLNKVTLQSYKPNLKQKPLSIAEIWLLPVLAAILNFFSNVNFNLTYVILIRSHDNITYGRIWSESVDPVLRYQFWRPFWILFQCELFDLCDLN